MAPVGIHNVLASEVGEGEFEPQNLGGAPRLRRGGSLRQWLGAQLALVAPSCLRTIRNPYAEQQDQHVNLIRHADCSLFKTHEVTHGFP